MSTKNYARVEGYICFDLNLRTTASGVNVCNFRVAVNRQSKDKGVDYIDCVAFGDRANNIVKFFEKGSAIECEGELRTNNREKNGVTYNEMSIAVSNWGFPTVNTRVDTKKLQDSSNENDNFDIDDDEDDDIEAPW